MLFVPQSVFENTTLSDEADSLFGLGLETINIADEFDLGWAAIANDTVWLPPFSFIVTDLDEVVNDGGIFGGMSTSYMIVPSSGITSHDIRKMLIRSVNKNFI